MLSLLMHRSTVVGIIGRTYATAIPSRRSFQARPPPPQGSQPEGPLRPHLNVLVNPNHGLHGFFRRRTNDNSHRPPNENGPAEYIALERPVELTSGNVASPRV